MGLGWGPIDDIAGGVADAGKFVGGHAGGAAKATAKVGAKVGGKVLAPLGVGLSGHSALTTDDQGKLSQANTFMHDFAMLEYIDKVPGVKLSESGVIAPNGDSWGQYLTEQEKNYDKASAKADAAAAKREAKRDGASKDELNPAQKIAAGLGDQGGGAMQALKGALVDKDGSLTSMSKMGLAAGGMFAAKKLWDRVREPEMAQPQFAPMGTGMMPAPYQSAYPAPEPRGIDIPGIPFI